MLARQLVQIEMRRQQVAPPEIDNRAVARLAALPISFDHPHVFVLDALAARRANHPQGIQFFCSTAPQAFFRPDRRFTRPARADTVKDGLLATAKGGAKRP